MSAPARTVVSLSSSRGAARESPTLVRWGGIPVIGSLGVLLGAKQPGHLAAASHVLDRMGEPGIFVSSSLRQRVLHFAGEA